MNKNSRLIRMLAIVVTAGQAYVSQGCARTSPAAAEVKMPMVVVSSTDLGSLPSGSRRITRLAKIGNSSDSVVRISRWTVSCECLGIDPSSIDVGPGQSTYIRLTFDPAKENDKFVGDLRISVEGFDEQQRVCLFDVPVSVVSPKELKHLTPVAE